MEPMLRSYLSKRWDCDDKVSVHSAKLEEIQDILVIPDGYSFIMLFTGVIGQILYFLQKRNFRHPD